MTTATPTVTKKTNFERFDDAGCLSYIVVSEAGNAVVIDPSFKTELYEKFLRDNNLTLAYTIDTHNHADHRSGSIRLKEEYPGLRYIAHKNTLTQKNQGLEIARKIGIEDIIAHNNASIPDILVEDGEIVKLDNLDIQFIHTPGHTTDSTTILIGEKLFTGDSLFIGQIGRMDLPGGNPSEMYNSLMTKIAALPDATQVYPGHDYSGNIESTIGYEKANNKFLGFATVAEFLDYSKGFFPPLPEKGAKLACGTIDTGKLSCGVSTPATAMRADDMASINITPEEVLANKAKYFIIDVREPRELLEEGRIEGTLNIPQGVVPVRLQDVPRDKPVVIHCKAGGRSANITNFLINKGYTNVQNMVGGMDSWKMKKLPFVR